MTGGAVSKAAEIVAGRIKRIAAHLLQSTPDEVVFRDGRIFANYASLTYEDVGRAWYMRPDQLSDDVDSGGLDRPPHTSRRSMTAYFPMPATRPMSPSTRRTCRNPRLRDRRGLRADGQSNDRGRSDLRRRGARGRNRPCSRKALDDANGQPLASTGNGLFLRPTELPRFRIHHKETPSPYSLHGLKGVGEGGAIAPAAAIVNAINDALAPLQAIVRQIPATPDRILAAISAAQEHRTEFVAWSRPR